MSRAISRNFWIAMGLACVALWLTIFVAGLTINSKPYRDALGNGFDLALVVQVALFYTPTNTAILTCLAGLMGGVSSFLTFHGQAPGETPSAPELQRMLVRTENPFASLLRSFVVYLLFIAGIAITTDAPFANPTPDQYLRIAGLLSLVGFVVGYDPSAFNSLLKRVPLAGGKPGS